MRAQVLQHVAFEGPGSIGAWLGARGAEVGHTRFYEEGWVLPELAGLDLIVVMGGPMSVNDEAELPWLVREKEFVREAIKRGVAVLGICLGAQLIANALGARVFSGREKEIGWWPIEGTAGAEGSFRFPPAATVFHWHGETFDLPEGGTRLARSAGCENQAFQVGSRVIGLQFHLETTAESLEAIVANCGDELKEAAYVQIEAEIRATGPGNFARINLLMTEVLAYLTRA